jgi:hypothetical protein
VARDGSNVERGLCEFSIVLGHFHFHYHINVIVKLLEDTANASELKGGK